MIYGFFSVIVHMLGGVIAAAILALGFAFLIFLGDANARGRPLFSRGLDGLLTLIVYASWFAPLWWFGISRPLLILACLVTTILCLVYVASYRKTAAAQASPPLRS
jgi:hypothetical protein